MNKFITTLIFLFSLSNSHAQGLDSFLNELKKQPKQDSVKAYLCVEIAWEYLENNVDSALIYASQALKHAKATKNAIQMVDAYNVSGNIYRYQGKFELAIKSFNLAIEVLKKTEGSYKKYCSVYTNLGNVYNSTRDFSLAIHHYKNALHLAEIYQDDNYLLNVYNNLIGVYQLLGQYDVGLTYSKKALQLCKSNKDTLQEGFVMANIGHIFMGQNKYEDAIIYFNKAVDILESRNYVYALPNVLNNLGIAYRNLNNHKASLIVYEQALKIYEDINDTLSKAMVLENMSMVFFDQNKFEKSIDYAKRALSYSVQFSDTASMIKINNILADNYLKINQLKTAEENSANSLALLNKYKDDKNLIISVFQTIRQIKIYKGDYKAALFYTDSLIVLAKEVALNEYENNIGFFKVELDLVSKEREIEMLNTQNELKQKENDVKDAQLEKRRNQQIFLFGGLILVLVFAGFMYNRFKVTQKQNKLIEEQKQLVEKQKHIIEEKHKEVLDSIRYAKRIQDALITPMSYIERNIKRLKDL